MKNAFIIHGAYGNPQENWIPWLKSEIENIGYNVIVPQFPTPVGQNLENWLKVFEPHEKELNEETIIIGHSIAVAFVLRVLERVDVRIRAIFLIAGFLQGLNNDEFDKINETFYDKPFDWEKIKSACGKFEVFASDNDPNVPLWQSEEISKGLGVNLTLVKGAGHFNAKAGYTKFELLLEKIKEL